MSKHLRFGRHHSARLRCPELLGQFKLARETPHLTHRIASKLRSYGGVHVIEAPINLSAIAIGQRSVPNLAPFALPL